MCKNVTSIELSDALILYFYSRGLMAFLHTMWIVSEIKITK